jgi:hypothetical protein
MTDYLMSINHILSILLLNQEFWEKNIFFVVLITIKCIKLD